MRRGIRSALVAAATAAALALTGCAGLPTDGRVQPGQEANTSDTVPEFSFRPPPPPDGASPEQIVEGFLAAGSGPASGWAVARQYLADGIRDTWQPSAGVTVAVSGSLDATLTGDGQVAATLQSAATVDAAGTYSLAQDATTTLQFSLAQVDGQWRITATPDGIVLDEDIFPAVFRSYALAYWDPTWTYLVPDVRWFPRTNTATLIADALINGKPSAWLAGAVVSAFPDDIAPRQSVPVESGIAQVELGSAALGLDRVTQSRMQTQLEASMASAGITGVQLSVSGTPLDPGSAAVRSVDVSSQPLVLTGDGFGFVSGTQVAPVGGRSAVVVKAEPTAIQTSPAVDAAAVQLPTGAAARLTADGAVIVDDRASLVAPVLDPEGWLWSVPADQPSALIAVPADGSEPVSVAGAWSGATAVHAIRVSRDGARIAAVVTTGGRDEVWVAGVVRDSAGMPLSLTEPAYPIAELSGSGVALDWLDEVTVGVLDETSSGTVLHVQTVGGQADVLSAPAGAVQIAGTNQTSTVRVRDSAGVLYSRRGSTWGETLSGVAVLAVQLGRSS